MMHLLPYLVFAAAVALLVRPTGAYLARVFAGERTLLDPVLRPIERAIFRVAGVHADDEMQWPEYGSALLWFAAIGTLVLYAILRLQTVLPGGPDPSFLDTPMTPDLALNTAVSFSTATTWQAYAGESTMTYLSQVVGLAGQNFLAGATSLALGIAFIRGFARRDTPFIGSFWVDVTRATLWVLLPLAVVGSLVLVWQGVPMNFAPYVHATTVDGSQQIIPQGPVAVLALIENLGTNGGGFFNVNGAHPYQNPTPLSNVVQALAIAVVPASLTYTFGRMTGRRGAGWALFGVMLALFAAGICVCDAAERAGNPAILGMNVAGGNMEGKETRFGIGGSVLNAVVTSNGACGAYNSMHGSYTPIGVMVPLVNILLGEITFGAIGTGLFSMIMVALIGLFLAGLMVGRTPEYIGKRLGPREMKPVLVYMLVYPFAILLFTAAALRSDAALSGLTTNSGSWGFTEILFAYASSVGNNGQSMAGLSANSVYYNFTTAAAMMVGRFFLAIPALALAGRLASQGRRPTTSGTLPSDTLAFAAIAIAAAILIGALCFFPALLLGPVVEHLSLPR